MIKMSVSWLEKRRRDGKGPPWHRVPDTNRVIYVLTELEAWIAETPLRNVTWSDLREDSTA